jgi:L-2-hydroxyglutarate oxidase LhgO
MATVSAAQPGDCAADIAVVGAGIVGLATARALSRRHPGLRVVVLDKEGRVAQHQTGRNSGVIHSGLYYAPGSLKAQLCARGGAALTAYCDERGIPYRRCGKVVVAASPSEARRLEELYRRGVANGVPGLELIGPQRLRELEPHVAGIGALHVPGTGIVDYRQVARAFAEDVEAAGGEILLGHEVKGMRRSRGRVLVQTGAGDVDARHVVVCAGVYADRLARAGGGDPEPRIVPFRGDYYALRPERRDLVNALVYPVPDPSLPFLGIHTTLRLDGSMWLGPNAVLAFGREGYGRFQLHPRDLAETLRSSGFRRLARRYWRTGLAELVRGYSTRLFVASARRLIPELAAEDVVPGPSGIRAQALAADGTLVDDFVLEVRDRVVHVRNAPSPGATSSLAIGEHICRTATTALGL